MRRRLSMRAFAGRRVEILAGTFGLLVLQVVIGGSYLRHGGFAYDDWSLEADTKFHGFGGTINYLTAASPRRPLGAIYFAATHAILGTHEHVHLALAAAAHVAVALALFLVLRRVGLDRVTAGASAALSLLFPFSDASWLWATGGQLGVCVSLWLLGLLAALVGLEAERRARAWHALALVLYVASVLVYELTLIVVVLSGAVYLLRAPARKALRWWAADLAVVGLAVLFVTSRVVKLIHGHDIHQRQGVSGTLHHIRVIADEGVTLGAKTLVPFGTPDRFAVLAAVVGLLAVAGAVALRTSDTELRADLRRWLLLAVAGLLVTIGGWGMLSTSDLYYSPLQVGVGNRINVLAAVGLVLLATALVRILATLAFDALPRKRGVAGAVLVAVFAVAIGGAYLDHVGADRGAWLRAQRQQTAVLSSLRTSVARPPSGSTLIVRGFNLYTAPGVPVFAATWDLNGAARLLWHDDSIRAWPAPVGGLRCAPAGVSVDSVTRTGVQASYGQVLLADLTSGTRARIDRLAQCQALARSG